MLFLSPLLGRQRRGLGVAQAVPQAYLGTKFHSALPADDVPRSQKR